MSFITLDLCASTYVYFPGSYANPQPRGRETKPRRRMSRFRSLQPILQPVGVFDLHTRRTAGGWMGSARKSNTPHQHPDCRNLFWGQVHTECVQSRGTYVNVVTQRPWFVSGPTGKHMAFKLKRPHCIE